MKTIRIYQLDENNEKAMKFLFESYEDVKNELTLDLYKVVYTDEEEDDVELDDLFRKYNIGHKPENYKGHSLSVSDIVYMDEKFWYCNNYGWQEVKFKQFLIKVNGGVIDKASTIGELIEKAEAFEKTIKCRYQKENVMFDEPDGSVPGIEFTLLNVDPEPKKIYIVKAYGSSTYIDKFDTREEALEKANKLNEDYYQRKIWNVEEVIDETEA